MKNRTVPTTRQIQEELSRVKTIDDFFGKDGLIAKLIGPTMQEIKRRDG